jgi:glucose dehydrogenase
MTLVSRRSALVSIAALLWTSFAQAVDVWTVGVNNTRQGWNKLETVLTAANVPRLKKIREFIVDEKIDVSPLVVGDKLYVFTMTNTAFVFDVNTGAQLATRQLAAPFDPRPEFAQMDRWKIYHNWGITATPVIDVATNTIYVTTFGKPNANSQNNERNNMLWILDANTLADVKRFCRKVLA